MEWKTNPYFGSHIPKEWRPTFSRFLYPFAHSRCCKTLFFFKDSFFSVHWCICGMKRTFVRSGLSGRSFLIRMLTCHLVTSLPKRTIVFQPSIFSGYVSFMGMFLCFFLLFYPYLGRWSTLTNIFQVGRNHQLVLFPTKDLSSHFYGRGRGDHCPHQTCLPVGWKWVTRRWAKVFSMGSWYTRDR